MVKIEKCSFCSKNIYPGYGVMFVRNDNTVFRFCTSKCRKAFNMKRNPRKVAWTKSFRRMRGKDLKFDPTFEFERRRNTPLRYNRELFSKTVEAINKVTSIRHTREIRHIETRKRMAAAQYIASIRRDKRKDAATKIMRQLTLQRTQARRAENAKALQTATMDELPQLIPKEQQEFAEKIDEMMTTTSQTEPKRTRSTSAPKRTATKQVSKTSKLEKQKITEKQNSKPVGNK
eukprot:gnl/Chilomastix_caulleri/992.p1 GENE.gnl/Chilomastix_caulleri/992~~gnl/Chilomastix_caulleri/992.p1  ORF type:complete len:232 (-),score=55.88 gnl/Chilomastix_caulleri/992:30-725(-)